MPLDAVRALTPLPDDLRDAFDSLTPAVMRERGSLKWTQYGEAIGAWVAEMDLGTAPSVTAVLTRAVADGSLGYMPAGLARRARQEVARYQGDAFGWEVPVEHVTLLPDVLSALGAVIEHHTAPGSAVIVPTPAYMPFLSLPALHGRESLQVPALAGHDAAGSPTWALDLDGIEAAMAGGAGLLILCNPWNPVGRVLTGAELDDVAALSARYGVPVFADEIHGPLVLEPGLTHIPFASRAATDPDLTFTATAVSKGWNVPGLKCAQLIASGAARAAWDANPVSKHMGDEAAALGAQAVVAALGPAGRAWNEGVRGYLLENRELVAEALADVEGVELTPPSGSYLAWLRCTAPAVPEGASPMRYLLEHAGVATNAGETFGKGYEAICRLNLATGRGIEEETLDRVVRALGR